jgi:hypothetical protein
MAAKPLHSAVTPISLSPGLHELLAKLLDVDEIAHLKVDLSDIGRSQLEKRTSPIGWYHSIHLECVLMFDSMMHIKLRYKDKLIR